jgi:hypothetical protein
LTTTSNAGAGSARRRRRRLLGAAAAATFAVMLSASSASAWVWTSIVDFNLTESTSSYGQYTISSGESSAWYRWADDPDHTTVISGNSCGDLSLYGKTDIPAHNTSYHKMFNGFSGLCFVLRGRTAAGAGSMYNHDGVLQR